MAAVQKRSQPLPTASSPPPLQAPRPLALPCSARQPSLSLCSGLLFSHHLLTYSSQGPSQHRFPEAELCSQETGGGWGAHTAHTQELPPRDWGAGEQQMCGCRSAEKQRSLVCGEEVEGGGRCDQDPGSHPPQLWAVYFLPVLAGLDCFQPGPVLSRCGADFREFSRPCMSTPTPFDREGSQG